MFEKSRESIKDIIIMLMDEYINCPLTNRHLLINSILFWKDCLGNSSDILPQDILELLNQITKHNLTCTHQDASNILKQYSYKAKTDKANQEIVSLLEIATYLFSQKNDPNLNMSYTADNIISLIEIKLQITPASDKITLSKRISLIRKSFKKHKWVTLCNILDKFVSLPNLKKHQSCSKTDFESHDNYRKHSKKNKKPEPLKEPEERKENSPEKQDDYEQDIYEVDRTIDKTLLATALSNIKEIINSPGGIENKIDALQTAFNDVERILGISNPGNSINSSRMQNIASSIENSGILSDHSDSINQTTAPLIQETGLNQLLADFNHAYKKECGSILDHSGVDMHHLKIADDHASNHTPSETPNAPQKSFSQESMNKLLEEKKHHQ